MRVQLEAGVVPARVRVRGPVHVPELDLRGGPVGVHVQREGQFQHLLRLAPVHLGVDVEAPRAGRQPVRLGQRRGAEPPRHADGCQQRVNREL